MTQPPSSQPLAAARHAKAVLQERYAHSGWYRGVGIAPADDGFAVRLNVSPEARDLEASLPHECEGVPIQIVYIEGYAPRSAGSET
jgi:hypothetical protein